MLKSCGSENQPTMQKMGENTQTGKYLSVHFNSSNSSLKSPILIPADAVDNVRMKQQPYTFLSYSEYDPYLFRKENVISTFQYIFENVNFDKSKMLNCNLCFQDGLSTSSLSPWIPHYPCIPRPRFFSKLPPSQNYIFLDPTDSLDPLESAKFVRVSRDHDIFSSEDFTFEIDDYFNEITLLGIPVDDQLSPIVVTDFDPNHYQNCRGGVIPRDNVVSDINQLKLRDMAWRKGTE